MENISIEAPELTVAEYRAAIQDMVPQRKKSKHRPEILQGDKEDDFQFYYLYRGYKIQWKMYGNTPFTLRDEKGKLVDHCNEQSLVEMLATVDVLVDWIYHL